MTKTWQRIRTLVPIILLAMILARLVWIQLRTFTVEIPERSTYSFAYLNEYLGLVCTPGSPIADNIQGVQIWLASPLYTAVAGIACDQGVVGPMQLVRFNMWLLLLTTLMATLLVRFLTSSWFVSLAAAAMLLSRGHLIAQVGVSDADMLMMFFVTTWAAAIGHFVRTGATASLVALLVTGALGGLVSWPAAGLLGSIPCVLVAGYLFRRRLAGPVLRRLRSINQRMRFLVQQSGAWPQEEETGALGRVIGTLRFSLGLDFQSRVAPEHPWKPDYQRGTMVRTIQVPFALWIYHKRRWLKFAVLMMMGGIAVVGLAVIAHALLVDYAALTPVWSQAMGPLFPEGSWVAAWFRFQAGSVDLHLGVSLLVIALCAVQSPAEGLLGFIEGIWLILFAFVFLVLTTLIADMIDWSVITGNGMNPARFAPREVLDWFEPVILALGAAGVYNLMKVLDTRAGDRA